MIKRIFLITAATGLLVQAAVISNASTNAFPSPDISKWLSSQVPFSQDKMLENIHPSGTLPGTVVASTSRQNPPYFFHWTRDGALTMDVVVRLYKASRAGSDESKKYENMLWDYVELSKVHQREPGCAPKTDYCQANGGPGEPKVIS